MISGEDGGGGDGGGGKIFLTPGPCEEFERVLPPALYAACDVTASDGGAVYAVLLGRTLRFWTGRKDGHSPTYSQFDMPVVDTSMSGFAVLTREPVVVADVYEIPRSAPYRFTTRFDEAMGYRTKSWMSVPVLGENGAVLALLQLVNRKVDAALALEDEAAVHAHVVPYSEVDLARVQAIAALTGRLLSGFHPDAHPGGP